MIFSSRLSCRVTCAAIIGTAVLCAGPAKAALITNLIAEADAEINEVAPTSVDSGPNNLKFRTRSAGGTDPGHSRHEAMLLRFDISSLAGRVVDSATLNLTSAESDSAKTVFYYGVFEADSLVSGSPWDESALTYNTAPGLFADGFLPVAEGGDGVHQYSDMIPHASSSDPSTTVYVGGKSSGNWSLDNTVAFSDSRLNDFLNDAIALGDGTVSIYMHAGGGSSGAGRSVYSKEAPVVDAFKPNLSITHRAPEPAGLCLLGLSACGIVATRRRNARA